MASARHSRSAEHRLAGTTAAFVVTFLVSALLLMVFHRGPPHVAAPVVPWRATAGDFAVPESFSALPFNCMAGLGLGAAGTPSVAYISAVRAGTLGGHNLVTIQFANGQPAGTSISAQRGATFASGTNGNLVTLDGGYGVLVAAQTADAHTRYTGPSDIKTGDRVIREIRKVRDAGGVVQWAIGLSQLPCFRAAYLDQPTRLVIDFQ